jgi:hypothetical protein
MAKREIEVIPIHYTMYKCVEDRSDPRNCSECFKSIPSVEYSQRMMIDVEKFELFSFQDEEKGIKKFVELAQIEDVDPKVHSPVRLEPRRITEAFKESYLRHPNDENFMKNACEHYE